MIAHDKRTFHCTMQLPWSNNPHKRKPDGEPEEPEESLITIKPKSIKLGYDINCANSECPSPGRLIPAGSYVFQPGSNEKVVFHPDCAQCYTCEKPLCPDRRNLKTIYQRTIKPPPPSKRRQLELGPSSNVPRMFWLFYCRRRDGECAIEKRCHKCKNVLEIPIWERRSVENVKPGKEFPPYAVPASTEPQLHFHPECFVCYRCSKNLPLEFLPACIAGQVWCENDKGITTNFPHDIHYSDLQDVKSWDNSGSFCSVASATLLRCNPKGAPNGLVALRRVKESGPDGERRFSRELLLWFRLTDEGNPEHITKLYGVCYIDGVLNTVLEWADGGNILEYLRRNPSANIISLLTQAARGLRSTHNGAVIHGDIQGNNILVHAGVAKIADFSVARYRGQDTSAGDPRIVGARAFKAPELLTAILADVEEPKTSHTDVYAFGITIAQVIAAAGRKELADIWPEADFRRDRTRKPHDFAKSMTSSNYPPCRPKCPVFRSPFVYQTDCERELWDLAVLCWDNNVERKQMDDYLGVVETLEGLEVRSLSS